MTNQSQLQIIPLAKLSLAPENARYGRTYDKDELVALADSVRAAKRLLDPLKAYADGDGFKVWDGGRRLQVLQSLAAIKAAGKGMPEALKAGIPVLVDATKEQAALNSAATFVRSDMHPAEQFLAIKGLMDMGLDDAEIAAACALPEGRVRQLKRLRGVAPDLITEFAAGKYSLDVMEALSMTDDHERQHQVLKSFGKKTPDAWGLRQALRKGALSGTSWTAAYVGVEAYQAAGGALLVDLFERGHDKADWTDAQLAAKLEAEKLLAKEADLKEEGWASVVFVDPHDYYEHWKKGMEQLPKADWSEEVKAAGTVFCFRKHDGTLEIKRGWVKARKGASGGAGAAQAQGPAQQQPEVYGFGHGGHEVLTHVATVATRVALMKNPDAAYDGLLTHLAWGMLRGSDLGDVSRESASGWKIDREDIVPEVQVAGADELGEQLKAWSAKLPAGRIAFCDAIAALSAKQKSQLLAVCFAKSVRGTEPGLHSYQQRPTRWRHLGWMAKRAGVEITAAWKPDAEFLKKGTKDALLPAVMDMGGAEGMGNAKKGEIVAYVAKLAEGRAWVPKLLQTFTDVADPAKPASAPAMIEGAEAEGAIEAMEDAAAGDA